MHALETASRTVVEALKTGRIGTPVATRVVACASADHGHLEGAAAQAMAASARWLDAEPDRLTAAGGAEGGQISALLSYSSGQSSLVSVGSCGLGRPLLEIVVWGTRGILSWEACTGRSAAGEDESRAAKSLVNALRASLKSGQTVRVAGGEPLSGASTVKSRPQAEKEGTPEKPRSAKPPYGLLLVAGDHTHQPNYTEELLADGRCRLIGLTDQADLPERRRRLNEEMARRLKIPVLPDLKQALARDDVHVASICAEPARRGPIIVAAAEAGKHLYLDKPLAGTLQEADAIVDAVRQARVVSHMWSLVRTDAAAAARKSIQAGALGDVAAAHFDLCFAKGQAGTAELGERRKESPSPERYELLDSKRELSNVGVYPLVSLLWLLGKPVRRVCATTGNYFFREHQANDMEDFGQMLLELEGGMAATISVGRTGWRSYPAGGLNRTTLAGSQAAATFDAHRPRVAVWADVPCWEAPQRDPADPMGMWGGPKDPKYAPDPKQAWVTPPSSIEKSDAEHFLDCIEAGRASDVPASLAAQTTEILLAGYRSAASGSWVDLPLPRG